MANKDKLVIEGVRNPEVIRQWAQNRSIGNGDVAARDIDVDDPRRTVTIYGDGFHWNALVVMVKEIGDKLDVDCPSANFGLDAAMDAAEAPATDNAADIAVTIPFPELPEIATPDPPALEAEIVEG